MNERAFLERRQPDWDRLSQMLERARHGLSLTNLSESELKELGRLYRRVSSDLATAVSRSASPEIVDYLNGLVGKAHATIYSAKRTSVWKEIKHFLLGGFAALVRQNGLYVLTAAALFFIPFFIIFFGTVREQGGFGPFNTLNNNWLPEVPDPANASSFIMTNNIQVAFTAFALGVTFGLGTVASLIYNGWMIGYVAATAATADQGYALLTFVMPHGFIELTAIYISGGAGLMMALSLIRPGNLSRKDSLKTAAQPAVRMVGGVIAMLIIAGIIEGFLSPSRVPGYVKIAFGLATLVGLILYFSAAGRKKSERKYIVTD